MKTLYILRHAKSSWDDSDLADFDRPLNDRGKTTAPFMGEVMQRNGYAPAVIISSPAVRARETAKLAKQAGALEADIKLEERIYEASPQALQQVISEVDDRFDSAMVVGHNPGMEGFIRLLTGKSEPMPTASLAIIDLDTPSWAAIKPGSGTLTRIIRPKDEMKTFKKGN
jgi:phosphohistidine phosphatase